MIPKKLKIHTLVSSNDDDNEDENDRKQEFVKFEEDELISGLERHKNKKD